jgi:hypothetical protein
LSKTLRVVLRPSYNTYPVFEYTLYARNGMTFNGHPNIDAYDSRLGQYGTSTIVDGRGDIGTNGTLDMGLAPISGDVYQYAPAGTTLSGGVINGDLYTNSDPNTLSNYTPGTNPRGNNPDGTVDATPVHTAGNGPPLPAAPTAPANATQLPSGFSGTLAAGDYVVSSLGGEIQVSSGPVRLFVQGNGSSISLAGNSGDNVSGRAQNLQIYYNGTNDVNIRFSGNGTFTGVLYAPNANLVTNGNGHFFGAAVVNTARMNGGGNSGGFSYDVSLDQASSILAPLEDHLVAVTWQEI